MSARFLNQLRTLARAEPTYLNLSTSAYARADVLNCKSVGRLKPTFLTYLRTSTSTFLKWTTFFLFVLLCLRARPIVLLVPPRACVGASLLCDIHVQLGRAYWAVYGPAWFRCGTLNSARHGLILLVFPIFLKIYILCLSIDYKQQKYVSSFG